MGRLRDQHDPGACENRTSYPAKEYTLGGGNNESGTITKYFRSKGFYEHSGSLRFPYTIASTDEVSLDLTEWLQKELLADETVQQRLVIPRQKYFNENPSSVRRLLAWLDWKISPDYVLVLTDQRILLFIVPTNNNPPSLSAAPLDAILSVELARILLFAWFEWCWTTQDGLQRSRVYFRHG